MRLAAATATAILLLTGCDAKTPSTAPSSTPSSAPRSDPANDAPQYRFDIFELEAALPTTYLHHSLVVRLGGYSTSQVSGVPAGTSVRNGRPSTVE
jgi:hypothetical protein